MAWHCNTLCKEILVFSGNCSDSVPRIMAQYFVTTPSKRNVNSPENLNNEHPVVPKSKRKSAWPLIYAEIHWKKCRTWVIDSKSFSKHRVLGIQAYVGEVPTRVAEHPGHRQKVGPVANRIAAVTLKVLGYIAWELLPVKNGRTNDCRRCCWVLPCLFWVWIVSSFLPVGCFIFLFAVKVNHWTPKGNDFFWFFDFYLMDLGCTYS